MRKIHNFPETVLSNKLKFDIIHRFGFMELCYRCDKYGWLGYDEFIYTLDQINDLYFNKMMDISRLVFWMTKLDLSISFLKKEFLKLF
jgi:hypothetical protein